MIALSGPRDGASADIAFYQKLQADLASSPKTPNDSSFFLSPHRFRTADLAQLGSGNISLVDPDRGNKDVAENDSGKTISEGRSIEDAVRNGFAHGLFTLSEIQFDKGHKQAIVSYSFFCGSLCGNGGTLGLEKMDGAWQRKSRCHD